MYLVLFCEGKFKGIVIRRELIGVYLGFRDFILIIEKELING